MKYETCPDTLGQVFFIFFNPYDNFLTPLRNNYGSNIVYQMR